PPERSYNAPATRLSGEAATLARGEFHPSLRRRAETARPTQDEAGARAPPGLARRILFPAASISRATPGNPRARRAPRPRATRSFCLAHESRCAARFACRGHREPPRCAAAL